MIRAAASTLTFDAAGTRMSEIKDSVKEEAKPIMKKIIHLLLLIALLGGTVAAQSLDFSKLRRMFDYDRHMPLEMREVGIENRDGIQVHDISYASPKGGRITGYLVVPPGKGKFAGIIFMHMRPGSRTIFLDEALSYARMGAVSLLIDAPFSRAGESKRDFDPTVTHPEIDRDIYIQTVIDLRRGVDLLLSRRDIDRKRIGFVGHSFGAHTGVLLASVERRIKAYVIMAGGPSLTEFLRTSTIPGVVEVRNSLTKPQQENYFTTLATVDPINYIPHVAPSALFFSLVNEIPTPQNKAPLDTFKRRAIQNLSNGMTPDTLSTTKRATIVLCGCKGK